MRIAVFTPLRTGSAVGRFTVPAAEALARLGHDVELWVPERRAALLPTRLPVVRFTRRPGVVARLAGVDVAVYALGNNVALHGAILDVAAQHPGVVVLHDLVLHHLLLGQVVAGRWAVTDYLDALEAAHGAAARDEAVAARHAGLPGLTMDRAARQPLFAPALAGALGVVCHSRWQAGCVRRAWPGPVCALFLPRPPGDVPPRRSRTATGPLRLLSVGHLVENKRIGDAVAALARRPDLAGRVRYDVVGDLDERAPHVRALRAQIAAAGLEEVVRLHGRVPEAGLAGLLGRADVHLNLRDPPTEGASAALVEQLGTGAAVVVYATGAFAELPADAAMRVPARDVDGLGAALAALAADPDRRAAVGAAGRDHVRAHTPDRYATELVRFLETAPREAAVLALAERAGGALADLAVAPEDPAVASVERALQRLRGA